MANQILTPNNLDLQPTSILNPSPLPGKDSNINHEQFIAEGKIQKDKNLPKFNRTSLIQPKNLNEGGKTSLEINRWQNYFGGSDLEGLYDYDASGSDRTGFMAPEGFYQTDLISNETGFEQERGWINQPFQNYNFKGSNGNLKLYPGHEGFLQNPYVYTKTKDLDSTINSIYLEYKDEHEINNLSPQYTFTRGFSIDNKNEDRRLYNIPFADYTTTINNQDPIVFGYQLSIITETSPLFNGAIPDFLKRYSNMSDLKSRLTTYYQFFKSFISLFELEIVKSDLRGDNRVDYNSNYTDLDKWYTGFNQYAKNFTNSENGNNFNKTPYYLKKISGLDKLIEKNGFDGKNNFIDYGTDIITLTLNEDTNLSAGSLLMLYKTLSWSRRSGKKMIPDNLLRFDLEITVSETRHFNRVDGDKISADIPNTYTYYLYECQFIFDKMSHGDSIDMSAIKILEEGVDISFTYKYSTLKMSNYRPTGINSNNGLLNYEKRSIDNGKLNIYAGNTPIGSTANNYAISNPSDAYSKASRNLINKLGDFNKINDTDNTSSIPLYKMESKKPSDMVIANFDSNRLRKTVSATIIQPTITSKMKDEIKRLYDETKLKIISSNNSILYANEFSNNDGAKNNSNVYSSLYSDYDFYKTNNYGNITEKTHLLNIAEKDSFGRIKNRLINETNYKPIYKENIFLLPRIIPIIGLSVGNRNLNASAWVNLGVDNVYYDRFGISLGGRVKVGNTYLNGNVLFNSNGLGFNTGLGF